MNAPLILRSEHNSPLSRYAGIHPVPQLEHDPQDEVESAIVHDEVMFVYDAVACGASLAMVSALTRLETSQRLEFPSLISEVAVVCGKPSATLERMPSTLPRRLP